MAGGALARTRILMGEARHESPLPIALLPMKRDPLKAGAAGLYQGRLADLAGRIW